MISVTTETEDFTIALASGITAAHREAFDAEKQALRKEHEAITKKDEKMRRGRLIGYVAIGVAIAGVMILLSVLKVLPWVYTALVAGLLIGILIHLVSVRRVLPNQPSRELRAFNVKYQNYADRKLKYKEHLWEYNELATHPLRNLYFCRGKKALCVYDGDTPGTVNSFEFDFDAPEPDDMDPRDDEEVGIVFFPERVAVFGIPPLMHIAWEGDEPVMVTTDLLTGAPTNVYRSSVNTSGVAFGTVALDGTMTTNVDDMTGHTLYDVSELEAELPEG